VQGIGLIDALHDLGQGDIACLDQQVDVVVHENIRIDAAASAVFVHGKGEKVFLKIGSVLEDALFLVTADDNVRRRRRTRCAACGAWAEHRKDAGKCQDVRMSCLTLYPLLLFDNSTQILYCLPLYSAACFSPVGSNASHDSMQMFTASFTACSFV
jgi:hypothetical protein